MIRTRLSKSLYLSVGGLCLALSLYGQQTFRNESQSITTVPRLVRISNTFHPANGLPSAPVESVTLSVYHEETGGTPLWQETQNVNIDADGHYTVLMGSTLNDGVPLDLFSSSEPRWLGVLFNRPGETEQPRVRLASVPYALKASDSETLGGLPASAYLRAPSQASGSSGSATLESAATATASSSAAKLKPLITSGATANTLPLFTDGSGDLGNSVMSQSHGNIGIGTATPAYPLSIGGTYSALGNAIAIPNIASYASFDSAGSPRSLFWMDNSNPDVVHMRNNQRGIGGTISFDSRPGGASSLAILNNGNVGIGTTTPAYPLSIGGTYSALGNAIAIPNIASYASFDSAGSPRSLFWMDNSNPDVVHVRNNQRGIGGTISFDSQPGGAASITILNSGNVGIGTTTPAFKLDVAGPINGQSTAAFAGNVTVGGNLSVTGTTNFANLQGASTAANGAAVSGTNTATTGYPVGVQGNVNGAVGAGVNGNANQAGAVGVNGFNSATTGFGTGVWGGTNSPGGSGVYGVSNTTTGNADGVTGVANSPNANGVIGINNSTSGGVGVSGSTAGTSGAGVAGNASQAGASGVNGFNNATSGFAVGVNGGTNSPNGPGVNGFNGYNGATSGTYPVGVQGGVAGASGAGVQGNANQAGAFGVHGQNNATSGYAVGVQGNTNSTSGAGVQGGANQPGAVGVAGNNNATSGYAVGVSGNTNSTGGAGVQGNAHNNGAFGVVGFHFATSGYAVGTQGATSSPGGIGLLGVDWDCSGGSGCALVGGTAAQLQTAVDGTLIQGLSGPDKSINNLTTVFSVDGTGNGTFAHGVKAQSGDTIPGGQAGVFGFASATSGVTAGVGGVAVSPQGAGITGLSASSCDHTGCSLANGTAGSLYASNNNGGYLLRGFSGPQGNDFLTGTTQVFGVDGTGNVIVSNPGSGLILKSPDGTKCALISLSNTGALTTTSVTCP